jgi:hypothetical protein
MIKRHRSISGAAFSFKLVSFIDHETDVILWERLSSREWFMIRHKGFAALA